VPRSPAQGGALTLHTLNAKVLVLEPDWRDKLLTVISDPSLALVLMMVGVYGLLFEFMNPGYVAPGVIGGVALLLALWGLQMLPINYAGLGLILLGSAFFVAEAFVPSYGALGIGGVAAFAFGAVLLVDSEAPGFAIPWPLIAAVTALSATFIVGVAGMAARARKRPVVSGAAALLGAGGTVIEFAGGDGWADVSGERWRDGLTLEVSPAGEAQQPPAARSL
jgi:membrane-bound serine protease (ClpP class)